MLEVENQGARVAIKIGLFITGFCILNAAAMSCSGNEGTAGTGSTSGAGGATASSGSGNGSGSTSGSGSGSSASGDGSGSSSTGGIDGGTDSGSGSTSSGSTSSGSTSSASSGSASSGSTSSTSSASSASSSSAGSGSTSSSTSSSSSGGDGGVCASIATKANLVPLDMYIMLDQSGSMSDTVNGGGTKWSAVTQALATFVSQPNLHSISVGLQYFGLPASGMACNTQCFTDADCGAAACGPCFAAAPPTPGFCLGASGSGDSCVASDYAMPEVEIAPLPGVSAAIVSSMNQHMPTTSTPTSAALQGSIDHAKAWGTAHPSHDTIVVFATDGDPTECDTNLNNIYAIAGMGVSGMPRIPTFVIGVGPSLQALDGIAAAGGTMAAFHIDTNGNANQQFLDAMNTIGGAARGCSYSIPVPMMGMQNFALVNVQYTPGGGTPKILPQVTNKAACPAGPAWYYDDNLAPKRIILCDATCTTVAQDVNGEVDVLVGCPTVTK